VLSFGRSNTFAAPPPSCSNIRSNVPGGRVWPVAGFLCVVCVFARFCGVRAVTGRLGPFLGVRVQLCCSRNYCGAGRGHA
jgi:hypothetical protein